MNKTIYITESQKNIISKKLNESFIVNSEQVSDIVNYLNKFYKPITDYVGDIGVNGLPKPTLNIGYIANNQLLQTLSKEDLLDILNDKYRHFVSDEPTRLAYFSQIINDWLNNKVKITGQLSVNYINDNLIKNFNKNKNKK